MKDSREIDLQRVFPLTWSMRLDRLASTQNTGHVHQPIEAIEGVTEIIRPTRVLQQMSDL
jgi:hypothetical protein